MDDADTNLEQQQFLRHYEKITGNLLSHNTYFCTYDL